MTLLIGALTMGFILSLLALGTYLSFRILRSADITVDGTVPLGGAVAACLIVAGHSPWTATLAGAAVGAAAGFVTGTLATRFRVNALLAGVLTMTALYSVNLRVMGKSNISLHESVSLSSVCEKAGTTLFRSAEIRLLGWPVPARDVGFLLLSALFAVGTAVLLWAFYRTRLGTMLRASGDNPQMARAQGGNVERLYVLGLALSNGLAGLCGALLVQYQGFADVQMGIGMIVLGLASVIIGETFSDPRKIGLALAGTLLGSLLFRLIVALILRWGLNPNDLKLMTAVFVLLALFLPEFLRNLGRKLSRRARRAAEASPVPAGGASGR
ncbi:MAG: ABC transporter permease [Acidobacteria bacterium]|nr:ABC transporter permease [Acidobacteriota bacterium]